VIRNAILHLTNEQPLLVDLFEAPRPADVGLVCTNVRQLNGRRPIFVERSDSIFFFPYRQVRFLEVPAEALTAGSNDGAEAAGGSVGEPMRGRPSADPDVDEVELDPTFLERIREL
jgi:hypothetical protein